MVDLLFKLIDFLTQKSKASAEERHKVFQEYAEPLFRQISEAHDELIRVLLVVRSALRNNASAEELFHTVLSERATGRAGRRTIYGEAMVLREVLASREREGTNAITWLSDTTKQLLTRKKLVATHTFAVVCEAYFERDAEYWHELEHLQMEAFEQIHVAQSRKLAGTLRYRDGALLEECDTFLESRNGRWAPVATAFARCRIELLGL